MKKLSLFVLLLLVTFTLIGCSGGLVGGGSGGGANSARDNGGSMTLTVNWPEASKSIPSTTYSIKVNVCTQLSRTGMPTEYMRSVPATLIVRRDTSATSESVTINGIPSGAVTVITQAYSGTASEVAYGSRTTTIAQGDNSGVTVTLSSGTFPYNIIGPGNVTTPVSGGGGGGGTSAYYVFVNNYTDGTISVINQSTDAVAGTITLPSGAKPTKGVFDATGSNYYVVSGAPGNPKVYKIPITNTTTWSANTATELTIASGYITPGSTFQEIAYEKTASGYEYLWISAKYRPSTNYEAYLLRVNAAYPSSDVTSGADLAAGGIDYEFAGIFRPTGISDGKAIVLYVRANTLYAAACYLSSNMIMLNNANLVVGDASPKIANTLRSIGLVASNNVVYVPGVTSIRQYIYSDSANSLTYNSLYGGVFNDVIRFLWFSNVIYGISSNTLYYESDSTLSNLWSYAPTFGSLAGLADMVKSTDSTKIYITNFGTSTSSNRGAQVYVKTVNSLSSSPTSITVGNNPFGIAVKP